MSLVDKVKKLSNPMLVLHVFTKFLFGVGLGVVLAKYLAPFGWWIIGVSVVLSLIVCKEVFCPCKCCCGSKEESHEE